VHFSKEQEGASRGEKKKIPGSRALDARARQISEISGFSACRRRHRRIENGQSKASLSTLLLGSSMDTFKDMKAPAAEKCQLSTASKT